MKKWISLNQLQQMSRNDRWSGPFDGVQQHVRGAEQRTPRNEANAQQFGRRRGPVRRRRERRQSRLSPSRRQSSDNYETRQQSQRRAQGLDGRLAPIGDVAGRRWRRRRRRCSSAGYESIEADAVVHSLGIRFELFRSVLIFN